VSSAAPSAGPSAGPSASAAVSPSDVPIPSATTIDFTPGTVQSPRIVKLTADDQLNFNPGAIVIAEGETVTFEVTVIGKAEHEFKVGPAADVFADATTVPEIAGIKPGTTGTLTYTFKGPGPFAYACHAPGHFEHGMRGWFIVVGPDVPTVGTKDNPRVVQVNMNDQLKFLPDAIQVTPGETVLFVLTNSGNATHEFQIGPADKVAADEVDGKIVLEADKLDPGSTNQLTYTFDAPSPFAFACHEPGHYQAGMKGTIVLAGR
jgi:uncharacterized cupredoxin-like copper-binding protein